MCSVSSYVACNCYLHRGFTMTLEDVLKAKNNNFNLTTIVLNPHGGAQINECQKQAYMMACLMECDVEFSHNDVPYKYLWKDIRNILVKGNVSCVV